MNHRSRILVIGDTLLNQTFRVEPAILGHTRVPVAFLNEELTHLRAPPEWTLQGAGYLARYLAEAAPGRLVHLLTETRNDVYPGMIRQMLAGVGVEAWSIYEVEDRSASVTTRILRNVAASRSRGPQPEFRPQLRIDTPSQPLRPERGRGVALGEAIERAFAPLEAGDRCVLRPSARELLAGYGGEHEASRDRLRDAAAAILERAQARGVEVIVDLRPLPPDLEIRDPKTIVCTTIGRLRDAFGGDDPRALVEAAFWRLTPARALCCFAADAGVFVLERGDLRSRATLYHFPPAWPAIDYDGCGMVVGGDAFVAAFVDAVDAGAPLVDAARAAAAALALAMSQPLGDPVAPKETLARAESIEAGEPSTIEDPAGEPVLRLCAAITDGSADPFYGELVAPAGGAMRGYFDAVRETFDRWTPRPGSDLVAIFGESRSGKEYPLTVALKARGVEILGPVNMHQFLAETEGVLKELGVRSRRAGKPLALVIDEVVPDDASRSLLNLTAEKAYRRYGSVDEPLSFADNPVILLSSIDPDRLLRDMRGRLFRDLRVPPLRERQVEVPFMMPLAIRAAMGKARVDGLAGLRVSLRLMAALLAHDYRARDGAPSGFGLDQQNFRALGDLLAYLGARALPRVGEDRVLSLIADDLPGLLRPLAPRSLADDRWFTYAAPLKGPAIPGVPELG
ncbi:MAG: hypothetical protein R3B09_07190 [Nannocystaceae bacterium]